MMTRKHFQLIADTFQELHQMDSLNNAEHILLELVAQKLADKLKWENPRFDYDRFIDACNTYTLPPQKKG